MLISHTVTAFPMTVRNAEAIRDKIQAMVQANPPQYVKTRAVGLLGKLLAQKKNWMKDDPRQVNAASTAITSKRAEDVEETNGKRQKTAEH